MRTFSNSDALRVCRDLAWSELAAFAPVRAQLPSRLACAELSWANQATSGDLIAPWVNTDSLAQVSLATAAATWCNADEAGFSDLFLAKRTVPDWAQVMMRAREAGARDYSFATSGSTGARKIIRHREALIDMEAQAWAGLIDAYLRHRGTAAQRVVTLCPVHHIYGFIWGVCLPKMLGVPVVDASLDDMPAVQHGDIVVAVPDQWQWLARTQREWPLTALGISSTSPMPAQVHLQLEQRGLSLAQIYGSSETGGLAWRSSPTEPYRLFGNRERATHHGTPLDGIVQRMPDGQVFAMDVQDELNWVDHKRFMLVGRADAAIQVGGHNVQPDWVREQLISYPGVQDAAVRLDTGLAPPRLKAFVVCANDLDRAAFEQATCEQLPHYCAPASFTYGTELPRNAMGKLCDWPTSGP